MILIVEDTEDSRVLLALITEIDGELKYQYMKLAYEEWYQLPREQILHESMDEIESSENCQNLNPLIDRVLSGENVTFETELTYRNGVNRSIQGRYIAKEMSGKYISDLSAPL